MVKSFLTFIKNFIFKRNKDSDLYVIGKMAKSLPTKLLASIELKDIRSVRIEGRFTGLNDYIQSMDKMIRLIKTKEMVDIHFYLENDNRFNYLDDWLDSASADPYSVYSAHKLIRGRILTLIDVIYRYYDDDQEYFNYYKRLNVIHFHQLKQWITIIKNFKEH